jgi:heptaprenyl diphosphate synthase
MYSLAGAALSLLVMAILKKIGKLAILTISVAGAISHNIGQILVALFVTGISQILWYFIVLWLTAIGSGIVIGFLGMIIVKRFNSILMK